MSFGQGVERIFPTELQSHRQDRSAALGPRAPRQAVLPAWTARQGCASARGGDGALVVVDGILRSSSRGGAFKPGAGWGRHQVWTGSETLWLCSACWAFMPKAEATSLSVQGKVPSDRCQCSDCGAVGRFVSRLSPEGADRIIDLTLWAYAAALHQAGYEVDWYSDECNRDDHANCGGKVMRSSIAGTNDCVCNCHSKRNPAKSGPDDTID